MTREELINIFQETRSLSLGIFRMNTRSAVENTHVIFDGSSLINKNESKPQKIEVVKRGTIKTAIGVASEGKVAVLNFADPYTEGGMVFEGETTQEECICRCTNLYETLIKKECWEQYYMHNRSLEDNIFSDRLIYSEGVTVFKDENYNIYPEMAEIDVITCPAPIECNDISVFEKRIKCILGAAYNHEVDTIILGKWGCGAFGNSSELVAQAFKNVLDEYKLFDRVIFACLNDSEGTSTFERILLG